MPLGHVWELVGIALSDIGRARRDTRTIL